MNNHIISKNYYLQIALAQIISETDNKCSICIIDITTINSLNELYQHLLEFKKTSHFIFIGDNGIYSKALLPIISIDSRQPIESFVSRIKCCIGVSYNEVMRLLLEFMDMRGFTCDERNIIYSLLLNNSLADAARHNGINNKLFYQRLEKLSMKINMTNRFQSYQFFRKEYLPAYS